MSVAGKDNPPSPSSTTNTTDLTHSAEDRTDHGGQFDGLENWSVKRKHSKQGISNAPRFQRESKCHDGRNKKKGHGRNMIRNYEIGCVVRHVIEPRMNHLSECMD